MIKQKKNGIIFLIFSLIFTCLIFSVYYRCIIKGQEYKTLADSQYEYRTKTSELNYKLLDTNGIDLVKYKVRYFVDIVPPDFFFNDNDDSNYIALSIILKNFNKNFDISSQKEKLKEHAVTYELDKNTYDKIVKLSNLKGVYPHSYQAVDRTEAWSIENILTSEITKTNAEKASEGSLINYLYSKIKSNSYDETVFTKDINRNIVVESLSKNNENKDIKLTIDGKIENKIKNILLEPCYNKFRQIGVILMESKTGKIRAIVQKDDTLPNVLISTLFYPGSIFKMLVEEAAIEKIGLLPNDVYKCKGVNESNSHKLHGTMSVSQAFVISCNDIFSQIGNKLGSDSLLEYARKQGIFEKVLDLQNEASGELEVKNPSLADGSLGLTSIGQNERVTPIEILNLPATIANNGTYVKPTIIEGDNSEKRQVIKEITAAILKDQMKNVVKYGTATSAQTETIEIMGKTGTTERKGNAQGDINKNTMHSDGWFAGFFQYKDLNYSMVVFVQDIDPNSESGGTTAAPIFKKIATECINYLKIKKQ